MEPFFFPELIVYKITATDPSSKWSGPQSPVIASCYILYFVSLLT